MSSSPHPWTGSQLAWGVNSTGGYRCLPQGAAWGHVTHNETWDWPLLVTWRKPWKTGWLRPEGHSHKVSHSVHQCHASPPPQGPGASQEPWTSPAVGESWGGHTCGTAVLGGACCSSCSGGAAGARKVPGTLAAWNLPSLPGFALPSTAPSGQVFRGQKL